MCRANILHRKLIVILCLQLLAVISQVCAQQPPAAATDGKSDTNYKLTTEDLLEIDVFQEDDLTTKVRVSDDGLINFPLIGNVKIGGMTLDAAAQLIRSKLAKDFLVNPQVSVTVMEYSKRRFTVLGEVHNPGSYEMPGRDDVTLLEAVGMAGGFTRIADPSKLTLKRVSQGREIIYKLNAKNMAGDKVTSAFAILPGDIISVGESIF